MKRRSFFSAVAALCVAPVVPAAASVRQATFLPAGSLSLGLVGAGAAGPEFCFLPRTIGWTAGAWLGAQIEPL